MTTKDRPIGAAKRHYIQRYHKTRLNMQTVQKSIKKNPFTKEQRAMKLAIVTNNKLYLKKCIESHQIDLELGMLTSIKCNRLQFIKIFEVLVDDWYAYLKVAVQEGNVYLVNYFLDKIRNYKFKVFKIDYDKISDIIKIAANNGYLEIIKKILSQIDSDQINWNDTIKGNHSTGMWNWIMLNANGHWTVMNYAVEKGANDWNGALSDAIGRNDVDAIAYFLNKDSINYDKQLVTAAYNNNFELVKHFHNKGAKTLAEALTKTDNQEIRQYLENCLKK